MSVNIIVNGKYTKSSLRHDLLNDPEQVKKDAENERRKMRIQQVRAVSKNMAKKVRNDVEMEKERQLKKIEDIKIQEMEMWRQNVLAQQEKDFRSAIFQVGTAHRAAKAENAKQAKKMPLEKSGARSKESRHVTISSKGGKENIHRNVNVQTDITGKCYPKPVAPPVYRKSFNVSCKLRNDITSEFEEECGGENSTLGSAELSSNVLQSSTSSFSDSDEIHKRMGSKRSKPVTKLNKTNPILMEVHEESDTSLIDTPNIEDHHKQTNRHFSQIVSKQTPKKQNSKSLNISQELKAQTSNTLSHPSPTVAAKKRFTQISDIIRQQKSSDEVERQPMGASQQIVNTGKSPTKSKARSSIERSPRKAAGKSPTAYRPVSTQTAGTLASKSSSSVQSQRSNTARVQFYDYNNKFQKQYEQPTSAVEIHDPIADRLQMNAMQQAELGDKLREARELEMEKLRQKSAERCQKAIEKEQVRRACEDLTAKLDSLTNQRHIIPSDNYQFSSLRLGQVAAEKETKLNNAVEDILRRPAVITCPIVNHQPSHPFTLSHSAPRTNDNDLNLGSAVAGDNFTNLNSSDSCCSILLGYVNGQSKQIADDIKKYNNHNGETDKAKAEKLQNLLTRINRLREGLMSELEKCSTSTATNRERVQTMMDSISEFRKERENILVDSNSKDSLSKRENNLLKKEAILEKKLREFYEIQKAAKKRDRVIISNRLKEGTKDGANKVLSGDGWHEDAQRVPERQNKTSNRDVQRETKREEHARCNVKKREVIAENDSFSSEEVVKEEFCERRKLLVGENPLEIIIKVKSDAKSKKYKKLPSKSPRKLCTLIQSPAPKKIRKKLPVQSNESNSTSYRSLPPTIHNNVDKLLRNVPKPINEQTTAADIQPRAERQEVNKNQQKQISNLNPLLTHYVQRLLGMSRTSINALGVSSSDVDTPSSSIVNASANLSAEESEQLVSNRLEHVQRFIEDNYSFIGELEESIRQSNSADSSSKTIEVIWKKALKEQKQKKNQQVSQTVNNVKPTKSALKKPSTKQKSEDTQQSKLVDKSTQLTDNCTQRIAELTELIKKVRQEKQKILETTLSSGSENGRNSTEYLDLPDRRNNSEASSSRILDSQLVKSTEQSPESAPQLEKNKSIGISRDSGISESRPITVQESRDSPIEDLHQAQSSTDSLSFKKPKPPISIARYSPQLVEDIPHELSTIFEVDTPATSRVNTSIRANNDQELAAHQLRDERAENIVYKKFSTFEEYVQLNKLDMTQFDPEFSMQLEKEFTEFMNQAKEGNGTDYSQFTSFSKYFAKSSSGDDREAAQDLLTSLKLANLSFKKFPTTKEYLDKLGISTSDLLDSRSLDKTESSTESLLNIEEELKLRNILTRAFGQNGQEANEKDSSSSVASVSSQKLLEKKVHQTEISGIQQMTTSTDDQTDNLESGLKRLGIQWPSAMKKKIMETQALSSSTSSSIGPVVFTPKRKPVKNSSQEKANETTTQTEDGGRQLNLREFFTKEFLKLRTTSTSVSYSDDSIASSILRSIIGSMTPSPHQQENGAGTGLDRHKTSTPMASHSTSTGKEASRSHGGASSVQLFSGESRLSSVHFNNSSKGANQNTGKKVNTESD